MSGAIGAFFNFNIPLKNKLSPPPYHRKKISLHMLGKMATCNINNKLYINFLKIFYYRVNQSNSTPNFTKMAAKDKIIVFTKRKLNTHIYRSKQFNM